MKVYIPAVTKKQHPKKHGNQENTKYHINQRLISSEKSHEIKRNNWKLNKNVRINESTN